MGLKIVLDTNCLLQIMGANTKYHYLFDKFLHNEFILCISTDILLEYEEILKQKASITAADLFIKVISYSSNMIRKEPFYKFNLIQKDNDDNKFVDCAIVSQADYIVTNDNHFKELQDTPFPKIETINLEEFSKIVPKSS
ncbi:MAG: putative toxin-antitoxin system toxin component, PIN family [Bacteroidales bacterium]|nr:putative toxin-antitoxin system toxin component, PIN family [Bacteroidales bacterium]